MKKDKQNLNMMKDEELSKLLLNLEESLRDLRFKAQGSKSKNVKESASFRKQVARVLTEINKRKNDKHNKK